MSSIRELFERYLNQTSLLRKNFGSNWQCRQRDRLCIVSLSHQINDGRAAGYSEKEIIAARYIPFKAGESVVACLLTEKSGSQTRAQGNTMDIT